MKLQTESYTAPSVPPRIPSWIADPIDHDLGLNAESIQDSLIRLWNLPPGHRIFSLIAITWGYRDMQNPYAAAESIWLWEVALLLMNEESY